MTTSNISFEAIREAVCTWVNEVEKRYSAELSIEHVRSEADVYISFFYLKDCIAQVVVNKPDWAPYRYVFFEVVSILGERPQPVFTWCDCDEDDIDSIIQNLQTGIEFAIS